MLLINLTRLMGLGAFVCLLNPLRAQEVNFAQFFNFRTALNPAYVSVPNGVELSAGYRHQWPGLQGGLNGGFAGATARHCNTTLAYGLTIAQVGEQQFGYSVREIAAQLGAFVNTSRYSSLHIGFQATYGSRAISGGNQVFTGQLDPVFGIVRDNAGLVVLPEQLLQTFTLGGGVVWRGEVEFGRLKGPLSIGGAVRNLGGSRDISYQYLQVNLAPRWIAHASISFPVGQHFTNDIAVYISPLLRYDVQGPLREFFAGALLQFNSAYFGAMLQQARGVPGLPFTNQIYLTPGVQFNALNLGYTFGIPVNGLGVQSNGGTHEFNIRFAFENACALGARSPRPGKFRKGKRRSTNCYHFSGKNFFGFLN